MFKADFIICKHGRATIAKPLARIMRVWFEGSGQKFWFWGLMQRKGGGVYKFVPLKPCCTPIMVTAAGVASIN